MKKHLILLLLATSTLVAFADDTQIKTGSQAQELNPYNSGGKTIVYDIYSEYGDENTTKSPVVLNAASGNSSTVPYIRWYRVNTNLNKDNATSHSFSTANNANDLVTYRASTWINSATSNNSPSNLNKVAYTQVYDCHSIFQESHNYKITHDLTVPNGAEFHLIPTYYYRTDNYTYYLGYDGWLINFFYYYHPESWTYKRGNTTVANEQASCMYSSTATTNGTYTARWNRSSSYNEADSWKL
ncbi:MAG: hypothetical protein J5808_08000, partial [Paludibacteraceae bacterium]|nr:hypothetical protein [Paludibacteraceae bacterium]